jgi:hypothetical protein
MGWVSKLREQAGTSADGRRPWLTELRTAAEAMAKQSDDPWSSILENLKGHVVGGVERIPTFKIFEQLRIAPRHQTTAVRRRLAKRMSALGWTAIREYGANPRGFSTKLRGYARPASHEGEPRLPPNTTKAGRRPQPLM